MENYYHRWGKPLLSQQVVILKTVDGCVVTWRLYVERVEQQLGRHRGRLLSLQGPLAAQHGCPGIHLRRA
jgi:hypothetical protein